MRWVSPGHFARTLSRLFAYCPSISRWRSSSVVIRHLTLELTHTELYLFSDCPIPGVVQKLLLKRTTQGRHILDTVSLTIFDVLLNRIVLTVSQVLWTSRRTSGGITSTDTGKTSPGIDATIVVVAWRVVPDKWIRDEKIVRCFEVLLLISNVTFREGECWSSEGHKFVTNICVLLWINKARAK